MLEAVLFAPGNHPRRVEKALTLPVDAVILDLEDAVPPAEKARAREVVEAALAALQPAGEGAGRPARPEVWVRVNGPATGLMADDLAVAARPGVSGVFVPKVEDPDELRMAGWALDRLEIERGLPEGALRLAPFVESARGVLEARAIAGAPRVRCLAFGGLDFCYDLGVTPTREGQEVAAARAALVLASRAAGVEPPIDTVYPYLDDPDGLEADARTARRLGFQGKLLLHPDQIAPVRRAFAPTPDEVAYAREVVAAFRAAEAAGAGVARVGGRFIDRPVVLWAERVLARAERPGPGPPG